MNSERWDRILQEVRNRPSPVALIPHLCAVAKSLTHLDNFSICIHSAAGLLPLEGSDPIAVSADQMQNLWGVGPSLTVAAAGDAIHGGLLFVEDVTKELDPQWPVLGGLANQLGVVAIYAFSLRSGGARVGVLTGYSCQATSLTSQQIADGLVLATIITEVLLDVQAINQADKGPGHMSDPDFDHIATDEVFNELLSSFPTSSSYVHQAAGMLAERLHIGIVEAQIRLRALAFRRGGTLEDLSRQIIADHHIPELEA
jgi:hypothetical protein